MKVALIALLATFALHCTEAVFHAECKVQWILGTACEEVQTRVVDQMNAWDNEDCGTQPGDTEPNGQKCLYKWTGNSGLVTTGNHTTPIHRYVDMMTFTFIPHNGGCLIDGYSVSTPESIFDYGTNYCNLFNLLDGSGLILDPEFAEFTNDAICTQHSTADCDRF